MFSTRRAELGMIDLDKRLTEPKPITLYHATASIDDFDCAEDLGGVLNALVVSFGECR